MIAIPKYTKEAVQEWFDARKALDAVPSGQDWLPERDRLTAAEEVLMGQGWSNLETEEEMAVYLN